MKLIWADGGYAGKLVNWVMTFGGWALEIVKRPQEAKGFVLLKRRWVVERTFAWLSFFRRSSKDYEERTDGQYDIVLECLQESPQLFIFPESVHKNLLDELDEFVNAGRGIVWILSFWHYRLLLCYCP